jgi:THO complex subunit 2
MGKCCQVLSDRRIVTFKFSGSTCTADITNATIHFVSFYCHGVHLLTIWSMLLSCLCISSGIYLFVTKSTRLGCTRLMSTTTCQWFSSAGWRYFGYIMICFLPFHWSGAMPYVLSRSGTSSNQTAVRRRLYSEWRTTTCQSRLELCICQVQADRESGGILWHLSHNTIDTAAMTELAHSYSCIFSVTGHGRPDDGVWWSASIVVQALWYVTNMGFEVLVYIIPDPLSNVDKEMQHVYCFHN